MIDAWFDRNWWWLSVYLWPLEKIATSKWFDKVFEPVWDENGTHVSWLDEKAARKARDENKQINSGMYEWDRIYTDEFGWEPFTCNTIYNSPKKGSMTLIVTAHYGTEDIKVVDTYAIDCRKETLDLLFTRLKIEASEKLYKLEKENLKNSGFRS